MSARTNQPTNQNPNLPAHPSTHRHPLCAPATGPTTSQTSPPCMLPQVPLHHRPAHPVCWQHVQQCRYLPGLPPCHTHAGWATAYTGGGVEMAGAGAGVECSPGCAEANGRVCRPTAGGGPLPTLLVEQLHHPRTVRWLSGQLWPGASGCGPPRAECTAFTTNTTISVHGSMAHTPKLDCRCT